MFNIVLQKILHNFIKTTYFRGNLYQFWHNCNCIGFSIFPMICQVTTEDCVDLHSITTLLSMMSRCFSDCDESMRWVVDALMNDKSAMRRWKYYKSVMSRWCVDVFQKFKQCSNDVAMIVNDLRQVPRGKSHIYLSNCANFLLHKLFLLRHLFLF